MMLQLDLTDSWRETIPHCKRYTRRKANPLKQSRLYYVLSDYLIGNVEEADILPGYRSDLKLSFGKQIKRSTFWKCNCSLLKDKQHIDEINDEINNFIKEYTVRRVEPRHVDGELRYMKSVLLLLLLLS